MLIDLGLLRTSRFIQTAECLVTQIERGQGNNAETVFFFH